MIAIQGKYAYVANYASDTISVLDISNSIEPNFCNISAASTAPTTVAVQGRYLFVAHDTSDLLTFTT